jgi:hypothetical protein
MLGSFLASWATVDYKKANVARMEESRTVHKFWFENIERRDCLGELDVDSRILFSNNANNNANWF